MADINKAVRKHSIYALISSISSIIFLLLILFLILSGRIYPEKSIFDSGIYTLVYILTFLLSIVGMIFGIMTLIDIHKDAMLQGKALAIISIIIFFLSIILLLYLNSLTFPEPSPILIMQDNEPDARNASMNEPITLSRSTITIYNTSKTLVKIDIFNILDHELYQAEPFFACAFANKSVEVQYNKKDIAINSSTRYVAILEKGENTTSGRYACNVCVKDNSNTSGCNNAYTPKNFTLEIID
jgi:hypothetical protein